MSRNKSNLHSNKNHFKTETLNKNKIYESTESGLSISENISINSSDKKQRIYVKYLENILDQMRDMVVNPGGLNQKEPSSEHLDHSFS